jgi:hypothetical protein
MTIFVSLRRAVAKATPHKDATQPKIAAWKTNSYLFSIGYTRALLLGTALAQLAITGFGRCSSLDGLMSSTGVINV